MKVRVIATSQNHLEYILELPDGDINDYYFLYPEVIRALKDAVPLNSTQLGYPSIFSVKKEE